ncbi:MAG: hypothetical protein MJ201_05485 [Mycoplasmoidaceae bacterium]|nr:hypothetical protein [Mycoplasmoidaceae bacterium]
MKKILLIPITLTALTPMVSMVGCGEPEANEYRFEFTGNNCTIDGLAHFVTLIKKGEKVEYTVEPDSGHMLSSTQDLPEGVTLVGNILTIEKMDKPYTVTVNAALPLTIEGLKESYQGDIGVAGHTDPITVYYDDGESKTDVTTSTTFNLPSLQLT